MLENKVNNYRYYLRNYWTVPFSSFPPSWAIFFCNSSWFSSRMSGFSSFFSLSRVSSWMSPISSFFSWFWVVFPFSFASSFSFIWGPAWAVTVATSFAMWTVECWCSNFGCMKNDFGLSENSTILLVTLSKVSTIFSILSPAERR